MCAVLRLIHGSGWVHRDVSVGNIYLYEGRGLLGDLEFAKAMWDKGGHEVRTVCVLIVFSGPIYSSVPRGLSISWLPKF